MNTTTAAPVGGVDLAKNVFELAVADGGWRISERARLTRRQLERWFVNRRVGLVVMGDRGEALAGAPRRDRAGAGQVAGAGSSGWALPRAAGSGSSR